MERTETYKRYREAQETLLAAVLTYAMVPEENEALHEALKEAAVDFAHAEKEAWEAGDLAPLQPSPTFFGERTNENHR